MKDLQNFKFQFSEDSNSDSLRWCNNTQMRLKRVKLCWRKCKADFSITNKMFAQMTSFFVTDEHKELGILVVGCFNINIKA